MLPNASTAHLIQTKNIRRVTIRLVYLISYLLLNFFIYIKYLFFIWQLHNVTQIIDIIHPHTIEQGPESKLDINFKAYPNVNKQAIRWNILHTNFKGANWKWSIAKDSDVRKRLSYDQMVNNDVFRISEDMNIENKEHSLELFVSPGYQYNEYDAVGDELWIVEMVVKVYSFHIIVHTNIYCY